MPIGDHAKPTRADDLSLRVASHAPGAVEEADMVRDRFLAQAGVRAERVQVDGIAAGQEKLKRGLPHQSLRIARRLKGADGAHTQSGPMRVHVASRSAIGSRATSASSTI